MGTGASASTKQHEQIQEASVDQLAADVAGLSEEERAALHAAAEAGGDEAVGITPEEAAKLKEAETLIEIRAALAKARCRTGDSACLKQHEIVNVAVGSCGFHVNLKFWQGVMAEHLLDDGGRFTGGSHDNHLERSAVFFREVGETYRPRSVLVDLEAGTKDLSRRSSVGSVFNPGNYVTGEGGAGNNFAKGCYGDGAALVERAIEVVRKELELCESPQGLQFFHSLGGGTGSGAGGLLLEKLRDEHGKLVMSTVSIFPSPKVSDVVVEPYNAILACRKLIEHAHCTCIVDNEALYNEARYKQKLPEPNYADLNHLVRLALMGYSAPFRFKSMSTIDDLRTQCDRLVPFPRMKFLHVSHAPLFPADVSSHHNVDPEDMMKKVLQDDNFFTNMRLHDGKYIAAAFNFCGRDRKGFDDQLDKFIKDDSPHVDDWVKWEDWRSYNVVRNYVHQPPVETSQSMTMVGNHTATKTIFQRLATQFGAMFRRKAFLHWYKGEGMDEQEFEDADKCVRDLIYEYQDFQDAKLADGDK